jgi:hypothetical protein
MWTKIFICILLQDHVNSPALFHHMDRGDVDFLDSPQNITQICYNDAIIRIVYDV